MLRWWSHGLTVKEKAASILALMFIRRSWLLQRDAAKLAVLNTGWTVRPKGCQIIFTAASFGVIRIEDPDLCARITFRPKAAAAENQLLSSIAVQQKNHRIFLCRLEKFHWSGYIAAGSRKWLRRHIWQWKIWGWYCRCLQKCLGLSGKHRSVLATFSIVSILTWAILYEIFLQSHNQLPVPSSIQSTWRDIVVMQRWCRSTYFFRAPRNSGHGWNKPKGVLYGRMPIVKQRIG